MGYHKDIVSFAISSIYHCSSVDYNSRYEMMLCCPYELVDGLGNFQTAGEFPLINNGWNHGGESQIGKELNVSGHLWTKDKEEGDCYYQVLIVNQSPDSDVNEHDLAIVADHKEAIEEFIKDFSIQIVNQTIQKDCEIVWYS